MKGREGEREEKGRGEGVRREKRKERGRREEKGRGKCVCK